MSYFLSSRESKEVSFWIHKMRIEEITPHLHTPRLTVPDATRRSPRLPPEIMTLVIENISPKVYQGRITLLRIALWCCCFTCHDLLPISRQCLYEKIQFSRLMRPSKLKLFFTTLERMPHLRGLTHTIEIVKKEAFTRFLLRRMDLLPQLQTVTLWGIPILNPSLLATRRPFTSVTELKIFDTTFCSLVDLRRLIESFFPNVKYLTLRGVSFMSPWHSQFSGTSANDRLRSMSLLELHCPQKSGVVLPIPKWVSSTQTISSLRRFVGPLSCFNALSSCRKCVEIEISEIDTFDEECSFGAESLPVLQSLQVSLPKEQEVSWYCRTMRMCQPSPTLSCIKLSLDSYFKDHCYLLIDNTLTRLSFSNVKHVEVNPAHIGRFPKLMQKGMLKGNSQLL
ncbi:hypothetical protein C8Q75DRAFT_569330 [Abortiporus biennis]|nr:hypothetical protein C8Q75DRAFT_569330 [Abortiporus biennis]